MSTTGNHCRSCWIFLSVIPMLLVLSPVAAGETADNLPPDLVLRNAVQLADLFKGYSYPQA